MAQIYCLQNKINGKKYVGYTSRLNLQKRIVEHFKPRKANTPLYKAIAKYGKENFVWYQLYEGEDALEKEDGFIQLMGDYNVAAGGIGAAMLGRHHTQETKEKMKVAKFGVTFSEEHRKLISLKNTGRKHTIEARKNMTLGQLGHRCSVATKQKMSLAKKGKHNHFQSEETKKKISLANKGRISNMKGIPRSIETRRKISETKIRNNQLKKEIIS